MKTNSTLKNIVLTALFAAIIAVTTAYILHIPIGINGGYVHVGDCFIYLAACFLPLPYAMLAGAIGGGLADYLSAAPLWIIPTVIIKSLIAIPFSSKTEKILNKRNVLALFIAGAITCVGYYIAEAILFGNWASPFASMLGSVIQATGSGILFVVVSAALDKGAVKKRLITLNQN
ncbi:MAG: TIGR04002 family protein [Oscillospiraceae bacterium]